MGSLVGCGLSLGFLAGRWVMVGYPWIGCGLSTNDFGARGSGQPVGNPYPLDPCRALILGHYLMRIYPNAAISKAFAEKLGAKDIWSAKDFSKFSDKRAPILKEFSNKYSYNSELAKSIKKAFSGA